MFVVECDQSLQFIYLKFESQVIRVVLTHLEFGILLRMCDVCISFFFSRLLHQAVLDSVVVPPAVAASHAVVGLIFRSAVPAGVPMVAPWSEVTHVSVLPVGWPVTVVVLAPIWSWVARLVTMSRTVPLAAVIRVSSIQWSRLAVRTSHLLTADVSWVVAHRVATWPRRIHLRQLLPILSNVRDLVNEERLHRWETAFLDYHGIECSLQWLVLSLRRWKYAPEDMPHLGIGMIYTPLLKSTDEGFELRNKLPWLHRLDQRQLRKAVLGVGDSFVLPFVRFFLDYF